MPTATDLQQRWQYLRDGATLGAMLAHVSREGSLEDVAAALKALSRNQLEAACMALVLVHTEGASLVDPDAE